MQNLNPSQVTSHYWLYANNPKDKRVIDPNLTGKFMLFIDKNELDEKWKVVKKATEDGFFSYNSKCSTAKENPNAIDTNKGLICIYTASIYDMEEIKRVERAIRKIINHDDTLYYKSDIQTMTEITNDKLKLTYLYKFEKNTVFPFSTKKNILICGTIVLTVGYFIYRYKS